MSNSYPGEFLKQEISAILLFIHAEEISDDTNYKISIVLRRTRRKPTVIQDPGLNPSRDILLGSVLFEDFTWLGNGLRIFVVTNSYPGRSLKQEISAILLFSFIGDVVEVPERMKPVEPVLDVDLEKEKPSTASRSRCLRSSAPGQARKRKPTKTCGSVPRT